MSGSPGGLQAVPSAAVDPSIGATPCLRETSRGGGRRHPRIPFCKSGLQAGCGGASQCSHKTNRHSTAGLGRSARTRPRQAPRRARRKGAHRLLAAGGLGPGRRSTGSSMPLPRKSGHFRIARTGHFSFALTRCCPPALPKLRSKPACATCVDELRHPQRIDSASRLQVVGALPRAARRIAFADSRFPVTHGNLECLIR